MATLSDDLDQLLAEAAAGGLSREAQTRAAEVLRQNPAARQRYAEYRLAIERAAQASLKPAAAPAHLEARLRAAVAAERKPAPARAGWWQMLFGAPAARAWAAAALAAVIGLGAVSATLSGQLAQQREAASASAAREREAAQAAGAAREREARFAAVLNAVLTTPGGISVALAGDASGRLMCAPDKPGILAMTGLRPGQRYQVVLTRNGAAENKGELLAAADGTAQIIVDTLPWQQYSQIDLIDPGTATSVARGTIVYRDRG